MNKFIRMLSKRYFSLPLRDQVVGNADQIPPQNEIFNPLALPTNQNSTPAPRSDNNLITAVGWVGET